MESDDERSTVLVSWAITIAQGVMIGSGVALMVLIGYIIVEVGQ